MEGREEVSNFARAQPHSHVHGVNLRFDALLPPTQEFIVQPLAFGKGDSSLAAAKQALAYLEEERNPQRGRRSR
jgi:hypothetical protein